MRRTFGNHSLAWAWVAASLLLCPAGHVLAQAETWTAKASMPTARYTVASGVVVGTLYAVGGQNLSNTLATVEAYDAATNTWIPRAPMPTPRGSLGVGVINGILYAVGGSATTQGSALSTVEAYDPVTNSWSAKAAMPTARWSFGVGVVNGILYAVGGYDGSYLATVEAYDPATNSWTAKAPMPAARSALAVGVANGILYAIGGFGNSGAVSTVEAYDPVTDSWVSAAPMPNVRYTLAAGVVNGTVYAAGGGDAGGNPVATLEAYNAATNSWATKASMPTARVELAVGVVNGIVHAVGGLNASGILGTHEAFTPAGSELEVGIDIKPGATPNSINLGSAGVVPVAILSSATFDATQVDPESVTLAGAAVRLIGRGSKYACSKEDVNGDGRTDLVCNVETAQFLIEPGSTSAELTATTFAGQRIRGVDSIQIVQ